MKTITPRISVIAILALAALFSVCRVDARPGANRMEFDLALKGTAYAFIEGEPAEMSVQGSGQVFDDGRATGTIQIRVVGGESFLYRLVGGQVAVEDETVVEVMLTVERVGEGGTPTGETDQVIMRPSSVADDCLIYTTVGSDIVFEAKTKVVIKVTGPYER